MASCQARPIRLLLARTKRFPVPRERLPAQGRVARFVVGAASERATDPGFHEPIGETTCVCRIVLARPGVKSLSPLIEYDLLWGAVSVPGAALSRQSNEIAARPTKGHALPSELPHGLSNATRGPGPVFAVHARSGWVNHAIGRNTENLTLHQKATLAFFITQQRIRVCCVFVERISR
jgi:hypothetical protein